MKLGLEGDDSRTFGNHLLMLCWLLAGTCVQPPDRSYLLQKLGWRLLEIVQKPLFWQLVRLLSCLMRVY